jgi:hypothetical protein
LTPIARRSFDYRGLDAAMAFADNAMRNARRALAQLAGHRQVERPSGWGSGDGQISVVE